MAKGKTNLVKCLFNQHDFSKRFWGYKNTYICVRCQQKSVTRQFTRSRRFLVELFGDVIDGKIVHYVGEYNEKWLSNGEWFYDKKRDCRRKKKQVWRKKKPKNWIYEKFM